LKPIDRSRTHCFGVTKRSETSNKREHFGQFSSPRIEFQGADRSLESRGKLQSAVFAGGVLTLLDAFLTVLADFPFFGHFWAPFFPLWSLFGPRTTSHTHREGEADVLPIRDTIVDRRSVRNRCQKSDPKNVPKMTPQSDLSKARVQILECKMMTKVCKLMFPINDMDREWTANGPVTDREWTGDGP
jgi:hypothetical protein